jgi:hypothetical protein
MIGGHVEHHTDDVKLTPDVSYILPSRTMLQIARRSVSDRQNGNID